MFRYELQAQDNARLGSLAWPMFRKDPRRTGSWTEPPLTQSACPEAGGGYWLLASDGGIFAFCDAAYHGSTGSVRLNQAVVGMTGTPSGDGYWPLRPTAASSLSAELSFTAPQGESGLINPS